MSPPGNDERRPVRSGGSSSRLASQSQCDTNLGRSASRTDDVNVYAVAYFIVGTRGRCRLVLIVARCCFCGRAHAHNAPTDFLAGRRKASCHLGRYVVHVGAVEGAVAA